MLAPSKEWLLDYLESGTCYGKRVCDKCPYDGKDGRSRVECEIIAMQDAAELIRKQAADIEWLTYERDALVKEREAKAALRPIMFMKAGDTE